jgi:hypothetical protein
VKDNTFTKFTWGNHGNDAETANHEYCPLHWRAKTNLSKDLKNLQVGKCNHYL